VAGLDRGKSGQPAGHVVRRGRVEWLYRHEGGKRQPDYFRVAQGDVSGDHAIGFEAADSLVHGGHREACLPGELSEAHAPVA
jgi:hypothetical protein